MGPTLQQQFANARSAYLEAKARHKPTRQLRKRMCDLKTRLLKAESKADRKEKR